MALNQNHVLSRPPPTPCYIPLCRGPLLHIFVANDWSRYALQKNLVAKVLSQARRFCYKPMSRNGRRSLLQTPQNQQIVIHINPRPYSDLYTPKASKPKALHPPIWHPSGRSPRQQRQGLAWLQSCVVSGRLGRSPYVLPGPQK